MLVGDIGGTKTRLAIVREESAAVYVETLETHASADYPDLADLISSSGLLAKSGIKAACLGVAGPVRDNRCQVTNLPWVVDAAQLAADLCLPQVAIINDLEAVGWGLDQLADEQLLCLNAGEPDPRGNQSIVAPGTGLGEAFRVWDGRRYLTSASEGSHADFSPSDDRDCDMLRWLAAQHGHVSWERLVSGSGIPVLHRYLVEQQGRPVSGSLATAIAAGDPAAAIVASARVAEDATSVEAVDWFLGLLGAETGNHALKVMASGGVYLAGGIPPKIFDLLKQGPFLDRFFDKGRMSGLMRRMPVHVVLDEQVALLGAAAYGLAASDR